MYYFSEEERKSLSRGLVPRSRAIGVAEELRGWNWMEPPLEPSYDVRLAAYEVASRYCSSGRDIYLRRVMKVRAPATPSMVRGRVLHSVVSEILTEAKKFLYTYGHSACSSILGMADQVLEVADTDRQVLGDTYEDVLEEARMLRSYETIRIVSRIQDLVSRYPHISRDSLASLSIPVVVDQHLDGAMLGLSSHLRTDATTIGEPIVLDLKVGEKRDFHRLQTTAYALVTEALYDYPVNIGCIVYLNPSKGNLTVERDFHIITDEMRQWFVEERDAKAAIVGEGLDPGRATSCDAQCQFYKTCWS